MVIILAVRSCDRHFRCMSAQQAYVIWDNTTQSESMHHGSAQRSAWECSNWSIWFKTQQPSPLIEKNTRISLGAYIFRVDASGQKYSEISRRSVSISPRSGSGSSFFSVWWKGTMVTGPLRRSCLAVAASPAPSLLVRIYWTFTCDRGVWFCSHCTNYSQIVYEYWCISCL